MNAMSQTHNIYATKSTMYHPNSPVFLPTITP